LIVLTYTGLNLPNAEGDKNKESFVRFYQAKFIHYRRLENIEVNGIVIKRYLNNDQIILLNNFRIYEFRLTNICF
jgi:hypothetical protein